MTDKRKKHIRALMKKTGMSHQAASNALTDGVHPPADQSAIRSVAQLMGLLHVSTMLPVSVRCVAAIGRSADPAIAASQSRQLAEHPLFYAESGAGEIVVSPAEMAALVTAGAAEAGVQVLRAFRDDHHVTFSGRCSNCARWIWCGHTERETKCFCGHLYRVAFDLVPIDWSMPQGARCMDCGAVRHLTEPSEGRNPWVSVNDWQMRCAACVNDSVPHATIQVDTDERGMPFVRYRGEAPIEDVKVFVAENRLSVDWSKAFVSSTGVLNGRPVRFWRLPIIVQPADRPKLASDPSSPRLR